MDPVLINKVANKKARDVVTAEEWNEIINLLITQSNALSTQVAEMKNQLDAVLAGGEVKVTVVADLTTFGNKLPEDYMLKENMVTEINKMQRYVDDIIFKGEDV